MRAVVGVYRWSALPVRTTATETTTVRLMRIFVYGTLRDPDTATVVLDEFAHDGLATLRGLRRVDGTYPTLAPDSDPDALDAAAEWPGSGPFASASDRISQPTT